MSIEKNLNNVKSQLPNLTSLRFFLALFVVLYHLPEYCKNRGFPYFNSFSFFFKGNEAVLMFFSLSGFLIIRGLILEKEKSGFINLKKFFLRRILRIFPLYYLILILGFVFYKLIAPYFGFQDNQDYNIYFAFFLGATFFANILASLKPGGILEILWSIGIEEQFYLFVAPIFYKFRLKRVLIFLILFTIGYFLLFHFGPEQLNFLNKYSMYFFHFSFSGIIAFLSLNQKIKLNNIFKIAILLIFVLLFFSNIIENSVSNYWYSFICMLVFSTTIWILSLKEVPFFNTKIINHLGKISYGIYMYHAVVFQLIGFVFIKFNLPSLVSETQSIFLFYGSVIALTIIIAHFSYNYFELYFIKLKKH
jgi:peptidoglycan/LPS O-acetylase OafA/YrhL